MPRLGRLRHDPDCVCSLAGLLRRAPRRRSRPRYQWPTERPIRLIVPFQPGSSSDVIARIVSQRLAERLGQQIVVDNRVGASATLGSEAVARAEPDGYTMGLANTTTHASATALQAKPAYDPVKDFTPVVLIGSSPMVILATPKLAAQEYPGAARARQGEARHAQLCIGRPRQHRASRPARCWRRWATSGWCMCPIAAPRSR